MLGISELRYGSLCGSAAIPVGEYLACALLVWFGVSSIRSALALPAHTEAAPAAGGQGEGAAEEEAGELAEAREYLDKATVSPKPETLNHRQGGPL